MKNGILSKEAAFRIGHEELEGEIVQYTLRNNSIASDVYYKGKRIAGIVSIGDTGIIPID